MSVFSAQDGIRRSANPLLLVPSPPPIGTTVPGVVNEREEPTWAITNWEYKIHTEPFTIPLNEFLELGYDEAVNLQRLVRQRCSQLIEDAWKRGKRQIVISNNKVIFETEEMEDIPNEKIHALADEFKSPCYTFRAPDLVEESAWTIVDSEDQYPTLGLYLGPEDSGEPNLGNFYRIDADFDTGNAGLKVFDANKVSGDLSKFDALDLRGADHHGKPYTFYQKKAKICVRDESDEIHSVVARIQLVKEWAGCGLLQFSPNRSAFVGRDMLRLLRIKAELDPTRKVTRVYGISS